MEWGESFSVGVAVIDEQHQKLVEMLNKLSLAIRKGKEKKVLAEILEGLRDYIGYHFITEEDYFEAFDYEFADEHKEQHKEFAAKIVSFIEDLRNEKVFLSSNVLEFLSGWLKDHVKGSDMKYVECFHEHGLK